MTPAAFNASAKHPYPAPAKLNLFLHIVGAREDGRHDLQTLFRLLNYGDSMDYQIRDDAQVRMHCDDPGMENDDNLAARAAKLLQETCDVSRGVDIYLEKRIPIGAGLGGGSSDAATTLLALNELWHCALHKEQLLALGARLGADVPLFINGYSAWGEGLGERLTPMALKPAWYAVVTPNIALRTEQQFAHADLGRDAAPVTLRHYLRGATRNVFEPIARRHAAVDRLMRQSDDGAPIRLSGSGAAVYAEFEDEEAARRYARTLPDGARAFIADGVDVSPLHDALRIRHNI